MPKKEMGRIYSWRRCRRPAVFGGGGMEQNWLNCCCSKWRAQKHTTTKSSTTTKTVPCQKSHAKIGRIICSRQMVGITPKGLVYIYFFLCGGGNVVVGTLFFKEGFFNTFGNFFCPLISYLYDINLFTTWRIFFAEAVTWVSLMEQH